MRVLHLAESPYFGGINAHIRSVVRAFEDHPTVEIHVATLPGNRTDRWLFDNLGESRVFEFPMSSRFDFNAANRLREHVATQQIAIVHTHNYRATLLASYAKLPVPVVNTCHGMIVDPGLKLRVYQWMELRAMRHLAQTISVSDFVGDWLVSKGLPRKNVCTIYNGYEIGTPLTSLDRDVLGIPHSAVVFLFVGRLVHGKGIREFLNALHGIDSAFALVIGDGPLRGDSEAVARAGRVPAHFAGIQRDVSPYYRFADVVVLPSRMEALPMTLIEAAAHGKPVVASNVGGIPEVVVDGETGLLVKVRDHDQLCAALRKMMDHELRVRLGSAARTRWQQCYRIERMAAALEAIYRNVLGK